MQARGPARDEKKVDRPPIPSGPPAGGFGPVFDRPALRAANDVCGQIEAALKDRVSKAIASGSTGDLIRLHNHFRDLRREARFGPIATKKQLVEQGVKPPGPGQEANATDGGPQHPALDMFADMSFAEIGTDQ